MRLLVIDTVNYIDYPTGGIMAYYRTMLRPYGSDLVLVGIATDGLTRVGKWSKRKIDGTIYDYYTLSQEVPSSKKPLIPYRFKASYLIKKHISRILRTAPKFDYIFTQSHEVLFHIPDEWMCRTCFLSPGVSNPLSISRYSWARRLSSIYDRYYLMPKIAKVRWHLAAADRKSIENFAARSNGLFSADQVISFPTRYNDQYFKVLPLEECRKKLKLKRETVIYVTVGRLNWFKGWKLMIDAFKIQVKQNHDSILFFIGDGEDFSKIRNYSVECGVGECVELVGKKNQEQIAMFLNAANVFMMGSFTEGWSTTLVEACACGTPCVVTDFSSASEMIEDGRNGYVVKDRDPNNFAKSLRNCLLLDRKSVIEYDERFRYLSQSRIKNELETILNVK